MLCARRDSPSAIVVGDDDAARAQTRIEILQSAKCRLDKWTFEMHKRPHLFRQLLEDLRHPALLITSFGNSARACSTRASEVLRRELTGNGRRVVCVPC